MIVAGAITMPSTGHF